jgi:hypothetical protein
MRGAAPSVTALTTHSSARRPLSGDRLPPAGPELQR